MIRLGLVDCDTSHVVAFTQRLHHVDVGGDHWVDGARVVAAVPLPSLVSPERVPLFSSPSLRWDVPAQDVLARHEELGAVHSVDAFAPGTQHPRNPGFFPYGVHAVELAYALLGTGCRRVRCVRTEGADVALGEWADGRLATVRAVRDGAPVGLTEVGLPA